MFEGPYLDNYNTIIDSIHVRKRSKIEKYIFSEFDLSR